MKIEHELAKRALKTGERAFQHRKARTGKLGRALEIHVSKRLAKLKMLFRLEGEIVRVANAAQLNIVAFILAERHIIKRNIGNGGQCVAQFLAEAALVFFRMGEKIFQFAHFGLQLFSRAHVLCGHGLADFLRGGIAALLRCLHLADMLAALFIQRNQFGRKRSSPTLCERLVEGFRVFANPFDVEHGKKPFREIEQKRG